MMIKKLNVDMCGCAVFDGENNKVSAGARYKINMGFA
jgi:hypothetical protein